MKKIALKRFGKCIAIIALYGSRARGDYEDDSDLEFFSVIEDGKKVDIEFTFNGIPCDMWGQTWEYFEKVVKLDNYWILPAGTLSYCKIIYARSEQDKSRFESIVKEATQYGKYYEKNLQKATEFFNGMYEFLGKIQFAKFKNDKHEARDNCWKLIISATYIVAHVNSRPLKNNWGVNLHELYRFDKQPKNLQTLIENLVTESDFDQMIELGSELIENLRLYLISVTKSLPEESTLEMLRTSDSLAYLNKIKKAARNCDILAAGYAVHDFQSLIARDLMRIDKKWDKSSKIKIYSEYCNLYDQKYPDFYDSITNQNFNEIQRLVDSIYEMVLQYSATRIPNFRSLEELKSAYL